MYLQNVGSKVQDLEKALYNNNTNTHAYVCLQNVGSKFQCLETPQTKKILDQLAAQGFSKGKSFYKVMMIFFYWKSNVCCCIKTQNYCSLRVGLSKKLFSNAKEFPLRTWVVDNSGYMTNAVTLCHKFVATSNCFQTKEVACTRWAEMKDAVLHHAEISALSQAPTVFRVRFVWFKNTLHANYDYANKMFANF